MIQTLADWCTKKHFDIERDSVDMHEYHIIFFTYLKFMGLMPGSVTRESKVTIAFLLITGATALGLLLVSLVTNVKAGALGDTIECGTYVFMAILWVLWPITSQLHKSYYLALQTMMQDDFQFVYTKGRQYRKKYMDTQLNVWKACTACLILICFIAVIMWSVASLSILRYLAEHAHGDDLQRPHIIPLHLPNRLERQSPYYEILFVTMYFNIFGFGWVMSMFLIMYVVWVGQIIAKAEMVKLGIRWLLDDIAEPRNDEQLLNTRAILKGRMKDIVQRHYLMYSMLDSLKALYKNYLMYQQLATVPIICLTAFVFAEGLKEGLFDAIMLALSGAAVIQVFITNYGFTLIVLTFSSVIEECGEVEWWGAGAGAACVRTDLQLLMTRALRAPSLRSPGFKEMSLQTFSGLIASAYSYFNMLRQMT